jgi:phytoene dehydrogenase-like protein
MAGVPEDASDSRQRPRSDSGKACELIAASSEMTLRWFFSKGWRHPVKGIKTLGDQIAKMASRPGLTA